MGNISITLPDALHDYVERRIEECRYDDAGAFFRDLVQKDQEGRRLTVDELRERLRDAKASGISPRQVPEIMADVKAKLKADGRLKPDGESRFERRPSL